MHASHGNGAGAELWVCELGLVPYADALALQERKIASIGLHVSHGVSTHGFAVNVNNELEPFRWVVACGLPGVSMTSLAQELGSPRAVSLERFRTVMAERFCHAHAREMRLVSPARLGVQGLRARSLVREEATAT